MNPCELCEEYGCHNCALGNPCIGCADYDTENDTCTSEGACGAKMDEEKENKS